ncbi:MAG: hypothetical protein ABI706_18705 [Ilumatobacteraceae bacterium]
MTDEAPSDALTMLVYALDEMRETATLLPVAEVSRGQNRPWWRNLFFGFARSRAEVSAGLAVQYLGENVDRARTHWREALTLLADLQQTHATNEVVVTLIDDLRGAGLDTVLPRLQHDAIPHPIAKTAAHLTAVVESIRSCQRLAVAARSKLLLQQMRDI